MDTILTFLAAIALFVAIANTLSATLNALLATSSMAKYESSENVVAGIGWAAFWMISQYI